MYSQLSPGGCFLRAAKIFSETGNIKEKLEQEIGGEPGTDNGN